MLDGSYHVKFVQIHQEIAKEPRTLSGGRKLILGYNRKLMVRCLFVLRVYGPTRCHS